MDLWRRLWRVVVGTPAGRPQARAPEPVSHGHHADPEPVELPIDGELDLHTFRPSEVAALVDDYVRECQRRGVLQLRIVHGKGKGTLRRTVHARLQRLSAVREFRLAPPERGGWGATLVELHGAQPSRSTP